MSEMYEFQSKIDKIIEELHSIKVEMAKRNEFWETISPQMAKQIEQNRLSIAAQNIQIAQLNVKMMIFGASILVIIPIVSTAVFRFLDHGH